MTDRMETEDEVRAAGGIRLGAQGIRDRLAGQQFLGSYLNGFRYIISINADGSLEGMNNYGHYDVGRWSVDDDRHALIVAWQHGWDNTTTRLHALGDEIRMHDAETGKWRSSLVPVTGEKHDIKNHQF